MSIDEVARQYHEKTEEGKAFRAELDASTGHMVRLMAQPSFPHLLPTSDVGFHVSNYTESFYEAAFATEADLVKFLGLGAKALRLKPSQIRLEDGTGRISGHYLSLVGMDQNMKDSLRRVRIGTKIAVVQNDQVMSGHTQIRQGQSADVMAMCMEKNLNARNNAEKCAGRAHLVTLDTLMKKVAELNGVLWQICILGFGFVLLCHQTSKFRSAIQIQFLCYVINIIIYHVAIRPYR